jgi:hypothetical protein
LIGEGAENPCGAVRVFFFIVLGANDGKAKIQSLFASLAGIGQGVSKSRR